MSKDDIENAAKHVISLIQDSCLAWQPTGCISHDTMSSIFQEFHSRAKASSVNSPSIKQHICASFDNASWPVFFKESGIVRAWAQFLSLDTPSGRLDVSTSYSEFRSLCISSKPVGARVYSLALVTVAGSFYLMLAVYLNCLMQVLIERYYMIDIVKPALNDAGFRLIPFVPNTTIPNIFISTLVIMTALPTIIFHHFRYAIIRRFLAIQGTIFFFRGLTLTLTILPEPNKSCISDPIAGSVGEVVWYEAFRVFAGSRHTCGDMIFSGHTSIIVNLALFFHTYLDGWIGKMHAMRNTFLVWNWCVAVGGVISVVETHLHYTLDVFLGITVTVLVFKGYHFALKTMDRMREIELLALYESVNML